TVNCTASVLLAMYLAVAEEQGVPWTALGGTIQNDMLKEFIAQKEWICPPEPALRIMVDMMEFCSREVPRWHPVSISGYHIREAGSTAVQELAFTIADGITYVHPPRGIPPRPGARLHDRRRHPVRRGGSRARPPGRQLRAAALLLLHPPQRLPGGGGEAAGRAPPVGDDHARPLRRSRRALAPPPHPRADRGGLSHRAAAAQQHRARDRAGARRHPGRGAVAAHELARRDPRAPLRAGRDGSPPHAADPGRGERRHEHGRSARRQLGGRGPYRPPRG